MPKAFWVVLATTAAVIAGLSLEWRRHRRALASIPIRIHVNGTRGKSSVTRLIASILREQGIRTVAKTTGTAARIILPDGTEHAIPRDGPPNVGELVRTMRRADRLGAHAVVFECMAVDPELQQVAEDQMVRPTITVITNARLDHTDTQGSNPRDIARAFPVANGGTLVTADPLVAEIHGPRVRWQGGEVHLTDGALLDPRSLDGLRYFEHPDNVAVALEVARLLAIPRSVAMAGIRAASPDPGAGAVIEIPDPEGPWTLVNLFAANDPQSTFAALDTARTSFGLPRRQVLVFTSRAERMARTSEFATAIAGRQTDFAKIVVWGARSPAALRRFRARGVAGHLLVDGGSRSPKEFTELLVPLLAETRICVGMGNIVGTGQRWLEHLADRVASAEWPGAPDLEEALH